MGEKWQGWGDLQAGYRTDPQGWGITSGAILYVVSGQLGPNSAKSDFWTVPEIIEGVKAVQAQYNGAEDHEIWEKSRLVITGTAELLGLLETLAGEGVRPDKARECPLVMENNKYGLSEAGKAVLSDLDSDWRKYVGSRMAEKPSFSGYASAAGVMPSEDDDDAPPLAY